MPRPGADNWQILAKLDRRARTRAEAAHGPPGPAADNFHLYRPTRSALYDRHYMALYSIVTFSLGTGSAEKVCDGNQIPRLAPQRATGETHGMQQQSMLPTTAVALAGWSPRPCNAGCLHRVRPGRTGPDACPGGLRETSRWAIWVIWVIWGYG